MEKLIILDFAKGEVDIYPIVDTKDVLIEGLLAYLGHNIEDCQWMITDGSITFHKEVLLSETHEEL